MEPDRQGASGVAVGLISIRSGTETDPRIIVLMILVSTLLIDPELALLVVGSLWIHRRLSR